MHERNEITVLKQQIFSLFYNSVNDAIMTK